MGCMGKSYRVTLCAALMVRGLNSLEVRNARPLAMLLLLCTPMPGSDREKDA
jgi:hypothetical protein